MVVVVIEGGGGREHDQRHRNGGALIHLRLVKCMSGWDYIWTRVADGGPLHVTPLRQPLYAARGEASQRGLRSTDSGAGRPAGRPRCAASLGSCSRLTAPLSSLDIALSAAARRPGML